MSQARPNKQKIQTLFIVARDETAKYLTLKELFGSDEMVEVIMDRRSRNNPKRVVAGAADRRAHPGIDAALRTRGWAIVHGAEDWRRLMKNARTHSASCICHARGSTEIS